MEKRDDVPQSAFIHTESGTGFTGSAPAYNNSVIASWPPVIPMLRHESYP
jgi:hypothetical protein